MTKYQWIRVKLLLQIFPIINIFFFKCTHDIIPSEQKIEIKPNRIHAVRFDPSYYYNSDLKVKDLAAQLAQLWKNNGINAVFIKVYDPIYGAVYKTNHELNIETDYGRLDLLNAILRACQKVTIRVYAWIPAFQHKQVWEAHGDWRVKQLDGKDYRPSPESYFLCTRNPQFREWWMGFIHELLTRYRDIDGIDIAEPIVSWKQGDGCYCHLCQASYDRAENRPGTDSDESPNKIRSTPLTTLLQETCRFIRTQNKSASITTIATPRPDGRLLTPDEQRRLTGFDLNAILNSPEKPEIINCELLWQQWADTFMDTLTFSPKWTKWATKQFIAQVDNRTKIVIHPELTPLGQVNVTDKQFIESMVAVLETGVFGVDFYDSHQADTRGLWPMIKDTFDYIPMKKVTVFYDPAGENDARQLEVLLRHFNTVTTLIPLEDTYSYRLNPETVDIIFYMGVSQRNSLPSLFIQDIRKIQKPVCWLNYNIEYLGRQYLSGLGFSYDVLNEHGSYEIEYKNTLFPKIDSSLNHIQLYNDSPCQIIASAKSQDRQYPYAIKSDYFWYFADLPTNYVIEGGRHIVFSDLLHDILNEDHQEKHLALVRIEDVNPQSDPESLRDIANFLGSQNIPFAVGLSPFYVDPATNTTLALSEVPELVKAIRHMISKGGVIVLHGCTHQYRDQTTVDYEFWDSFTGGPIFQDSEAYVRERIERGLDECIQNRIYPLVWETPHYAASQMDYRIIDGIFSTIYERRQTMDLLGSDQLLPYFIPAQGNHSQMIPENLGYIPSSHPVPDGIIQHAKRNLAVRDGFASFFFHPFISLDVLRKLVKGIQALDYTFADIRLINNRVATSSQVICSGETTISLEVEDRYLDQFYITPGGKVKERVTSEQKMFTSFQKNLICPEKWMYVAETLDERRSTFPANLLSGLSKLPLKISGTWRSEPLVGMNTPMTPAILLDPRAEGALSVDQNSFLSALEAVGVDYKTISVFEFFDIPENINLLIIPLAAVKLLNEQQTLFILDGLAKGLNLVLEKSSPLSQKIGISTDEFIKEIRSVRNEYYPQVMISWNDMDHYSQLDVSGDYETFYTEPESSDPIIIGGEHGEGRYLFIGTTFDPITSMGYGHYPYILDLIQRHFEIWPTIKKESVEIFFDPGYREEISIEDLVKIWKKRGFRRIYAAGWHVYSDWTYEYERLIELAHQNAMLVYLWLEFPVVNEKFWQDHPDWRERTAAGKEAYFDDRPYMALSDTECRRTVFDTLARFIQDYDWDGVYLSEYSFTPGTEEESIDTYMPMHQSARDLFQIEYGFDPIKLFDPSSSHFSNRDNRDWDKFLNFQKNLSHQMHAACLNFLLAQKIQRKKYLDVVTIPKGYPEPSEDIRSSTLLTSQYNIVEKVDVVPFDGSVEHVSPIPYLTGLDLYHSIKDLLHEGNRIILHSESSIYEVDLPWIAFIYGRTSKEEIRSSEWKVNAPETVVFELNPSEHKNIIVNGKLWPAYHNGRGLLPPGNHTIQSLSATAKISSELKSSTRLVDISGELIACRSISRGLEVTCRSNSNNYLIVNEEPQSVFLNDQLIEAEILHGIPGYTIKLPPGNHKTKIVTRSRGTLPIKNFSLIISILIVIISTTAGIILLMLYVRNFRRRRTMNQK